MNTELLHDDKSLSESQVADFARFCETRIGRRFKDSQEFGDFSAVEYRRFWALFLEWSGPLREGDADIVCTDVHCEMATFFPNLRLNYAENLLRGSPGSDEAVALVSRGDAGPPRRLTRGELRAQVRALAAHLRDLDVEAGDRVVAIATNNAELIIGALASAAIGATFSSAAPDMGASAILSRFEQLSPKLLMTNLGRAPTGGSAGLADRVGEVVASLPTVRAVIALDDGAEPDGLAVPLLRLSRLLSSQADADLGEGWERFPFNHPLFILFTSGTTGPPKCIVHGAGGTLLEHLKEHRLHVDLRDQDVLFFHTTAAWMMWNWQLSALACGSRIVLFDGALKGPGSLWEIVSEESVTVFGTSPPYLRLCEAGGYSPRLRAPAPELRSVLSTGSVLETWQYDWLDEEVGKVAVQSISGGTDIIGCFVLGHPDLPVRRGMIQTRSLGLDVRSLPTGSTPSDSAAGELVCANPFPSRPLGFLGDDGTRFHDSYFSQNEGLWTHGDLIAFDEDGQSRIYGRSDGVLNIQGVRIGPSEIYQALRDVSEVDEAMAVEQRQKDGSRLILLVVLHEGQDLAPELILRIRKTIARHTTNLHVPGLVVAVDELPTTHSGKRSERAGAAAVNGRIADNSRALANPGSIERIQEAVLRTEATDADREVALVADDAPTIAKLRAIWEATLNVESIGPDDNFFDIGGTSLIAVRVFFLMKERMGTQMPLSTLLDAPTIAELAKLIDEPSGARKSAVLIRRGAGHPPLFFVHSIWGDVMEMRQIAFAMETDLPIYGLRARGVNPGEEPQKSVEEMAESCVQAIRAEQPQSPYRLAGYSYGGLVAYEAARRLTRLGAEVSWLGLIDAELSEYCFPAVLRWRHRSGIKVRRVVGEPRDLLRSLFRRAVRILRAAALRVVPDASIPELPESWQPGIWMEGASPNEQHLANICLAAAEAFHPKPYSGPVTYFKPKVRRLPLFADPLPAWEKVTRGGLNIELVPGSHLEMVSGENARTVAEQIDRHLASPDVDRPLAG